MQVVDIELEREKVAERSATCSSNTITKGQGKHGRVASSATKTTDSENNITIKEQKSPSKIQSMPLLAEHLMGKIPTNENSNMSVTSDKENHYSENLSGDAKTSSSAVQSTSFGGKKGNKMGSPAKVTANQPIVWKNSNSPTSKAATNLQSAGTVSANIVMPGVLNPQATLLIKTNPTQGKVLANPVPLQGRQAAQPTFILTNSLQNKCATSSQSTVTTSVAMTSVSTATTRSHSSSMVTSSVTGTPAEQTLYVRCSDNQGNVFLVPHHLLKHLPGNTVVKPSTVTASKANATPSTVSTASVKLVTPSAPSAVVGSSNAAKVSSTVTASPKVSTAPVMKTGQAILLTNTSGPNIAANKDKGQIVLSVGAGSLLTTGVQGQVKRTAVLGQGQGGSTAQSPSGPVLLIKTDQPPGVNPNLTLMSPLVNKSQGVASTGHVTINPANQIRLKLQGNPTQPMFTVRLPDQGAQKSQGPLKVTSQGLKSVEQGSPQKVVSSPSASGVTMVKTDSKNVDKLTKNCQLASLLTGEISLANRKPVQLATATSKTTVKTSMNEQKPNTHESNAPVVSMDKQNSSNGNVAGGLSKNVSLDQLKDASDKSVLKESSSSVPSSPVKSPSAVQGKTVLAKIGNQTLILQLPASDTKSASSSQVKGQGQQHTVTLSLKSEPKESTSPMKSLIKTESKTSILSTSSDKFDNATVPRKLNNKHDASVVSTKQLTEEKSILNLKKKRTIVVPPTHNVPKVIKSLR